MEKPQDDTESRLRGAALMLEMEERRNRARFKSRLTFALSFFTCLLFVGSGAVTITMAVMTGSLAHIDWSVWSTMIALVACASFALAILAAEDFVK